MEKKLKTRNNLWTNAFTYDRVSRTHSDNVEKQVHVRAQERSREEGHEQGLEQEKSYTRINSVITFSSASAFTFYFLVSIAIA